MFEYDFKKIKGCHPKKLTEKLLAKWRTGTSAANPAGALLLVKEIDKLRQEKLEVETELVAMQKSEDYRNANAPLHKRWGRED